MLGNPEISIIVPVYNVEKYIRRCVDSILAQTFENFELILVDDGSPDNCGKICDEYAQRDSRVVVIHIENSGQSVARNTGINIAKGRYIGFVDSDDYISTRMYEVLYKNAIDYKAEVSMCRLLDCYKNTEIKQDMEIKTIELDSEKAIEMVMKAEIITMCPANKLYKRDIFNYVCFPSNMIGEDSYVVVQSLHYANRIVLTTEIFYYYMHKKNSSITRDFTSIDLTMIKVYEKNLDLILNNYKRLKQVGMMRYCWAHFYVLDKMLCSKDFHDKNLQDGIVQNLRRNLKWILRSSEFTRSRKISALLLMININLYKVIVCINKKHIMKNLFN